jgi:molybdenum cofactor biosynthesis enzyme MoaA
MRTEVLLRLNRLIASNRLKFLAVLTADLIGARHLILRFDPVQACNLRCGMCQFSDDQWLKHHPVKRFSDDDIHRLAEMFFSQALQLHIGCAMEPTVYKGYPSLVTLGKRYKIPYVNLATNGQLLTPAAIRLMIEAGLDEITLSTHGINKDTYEQLMRGASFVTYHRNLKTLVDLKRELGKNKPAIRINYTVNPDNLLELSGFFDRFGDYQIDTLQVRPIIDLGNTDYKNKDMTGQIEQYNEIMDNLTLECHRRNVLLLANRVDPTYQLNNKYAVVYDKAVLRYLGPGGVWKDDFDFRTETYREHMSRIGYRRELLRYVLQGDELLLGPHFHASSEVFR